MAIFAVVALVAEGHLPRQRFPQFQGRTQAHLEGVHEVVFSQHDQGRPVNPLLLERLDEERTKQCISSDIIGR